MASLRPHRPLRRVSPRACISYILPPPITRLLPLVVAVPPAVGPLLVASLPRITVVPDQAAGRMTSLTVGRFSGIRSAMVRQARPAPGWALMQQLTANGRQRWLAEMECGEAGLLRSRLTRQRLTLATLPARRIVTITYQKTTL